MLMLGNDLALAVAEPLAAAEPGFLVVPVAGAGDT